MLDSRFLEGKDYGLLTDGRSVSKSAIIHKASSTTSLSPIVYKAHYLNHCAVSFLTIWLNSSIWLIIQFSYQRHDMRQYTQLRKGKYGDFSNKTRAIIHNIIIKYTLNYLWSFLLTCITVKKLKRMYFTDQSRRFFNFSHWYIQSYKVSINCNKERQSNGCR